LMGNTRDARMALFSYRLAPVQVSYLGYPGTTGSNQIDYVIGDDVFIPSHLDEYFTETVIRKPGCYMCFDDTTEISDKEFSRQELGLPEDAFVLTGFHSSYKITPFVFDSWCRILKRVDRAVLWLGKVNAIAEDNLRKEIEKRGISSQRLIFAEREDLKSDHLARHRCGDIFVDTFNYNAHSTAIEALWTGLPVVTLIGKNSFGRVGASLLTAIGLPELIAKTEEEYEEIIVSLANNPDKLSQIKQRLRENSKTSSLFNTEQSTRELERIYCGLIEGLKS